MKFNIIGNRRLFFVISGVIILVGIASLARFGLRPGVDFSGGSLTTVSFKQPIDRGSLEQELDRLGYARARVQPTGEGYFSLRTGPLDQRFVYYLMGATGICVVPLTGFCCKRPGYRITLLECDDQKRQWIFKTLASAMRTYLTSA